jgi:hypothetical protein
VFGGRRAFCPALREANYFWFQQAVEKRHLLRYASVSGAPTYFKYAYAPETSQALHMNVFRQPICSHFPTGW